MSRTVVVTGGAGFIGSHVARKLAERGDHVVVLDAQEPRGDAAWLLRPVMNRVTFIPASVESWPELVAAFGAHKPQAVVHTAAIGDPAAVHRRPHLALRVNVEGTINVLEACRLSAVKRVVVFSSIGALPGIRYQPVDTAHPVILPDEGPGSGFYGASKVACEAFCFGHRQAFGTDFIVLRPSAVYGFGMRHPIFIKPMVEDAVRGRKTRFANGREFPRDYTHVEDVAQLTLRALDADAEAVRDRVFYAATGRPLRTAADLADVVRRTVPGADIQIGPGLSESDRIEIRYRGVLSVENARQQLRYEPKYARLEDGVAEYVAAYRRFLGEQDRGAE